MPKVPLVRSYPYTIRTYQVGSTGKLSLHHLFNLFQDVAHRDALSFGFSYSQMLKHNSFWVLSRVAVEIDDLPSFDDDVELQTWVKSVSGPKSEREFTLTYEGKIVVRASSLWYCLSTENHRPTLVPLQDTLLELVNDEYAMSAGVSKVEFDSAQAEVQARAKVTAKDSDVDLVNHVNNAAYVRWITDLLRMGHPKDKIASFSINYLNEVRFGEALEVVQYEDEKGSFIHEIIHADSGKVACKTATAWHKA